MPKHSSLKITSTLLILWILASLFTPPVTAAPTGISDYAFLPTRYPRQSDAKVFLKLFATNDGLHVSGVVWKDPQGVTISCNPTPGGICATTYETAPNGVTTSGTWEFYISGKGRSSGWYTAIVTYCSNWTTSCNIWTDMSLTFYIAADPQTPIIATVPLGSSALGIGVNPSTNRIYVANGDTSISVIDGVSNTILTTIDVGSTPYAVSVNPTTNRIYVANANNDSVSVIDGLTNTVLTTVTLPEYSFPTGIGVNPTTNRIYVANAWAETISVIDGANSTIVATLTLPSGSNGPNAVGVNPLTNRIYVPNEYTHNLSVINGATNTIIATLQVGAYPTSVSVNPTTNRIYVGNPDDSTVTVINGASCTVLATVPAGSHALDLGVNPTTNHVFVSNSGLMVSVMNGTSAIVYATVPLPGPAGHIAVNPTTNRIYIANDDGNTVTVIQDGLAGQKKIYMPLIQRKTP